MEECSECTAHASVLKRLYDIFVYVSPRFGKKLQSASVDWLKISRQHMHCLAVCHTVNFMFAVKLKCLGVERFCKGSKKN